MLRHSFVWHIANALQCLNLNDTMKRCNFAYMEFAPFPTTSNARLISVIVCVLRVGFCLACLSKYFTDISKTSVYGLSEKSHRFIMIMMLVVGHKKNRKRKSSEFSFTSASKSQSWWCEMPLKKQPPHITDGAIAYIQRVTLLSYSFTF